MVNRLSDIRLVLFFTGSVSVKTWDKIGMLEREVAIYRRLQEHGLHVSFVTYGNTEDLRYADRIPGIRILCNRWRLPPSLYARLLHLLHVPHLWGADIFKTNQTNGAEVALRAARLFRRPLVARCGYMWSRNAAEEQGADSEASQHARTQEAQIFSASARVVVTAEHMKHYVAEQYGLAGNKVAVIPNYVLTDFFRPDLDIICKPGRICFVGRLEAEKNLFALLEAFRGLDVELEVIGDGSQRESLEVAARDEGVNAYFLGNRPHMALPQHLNAAEIFVLPSLYEGHPKTLLEAMACGRPVVGADVSGIRELISHRETGYLCGTSPPEIRAAIKDVLADKGLQKKMGKNARRFVVEHFSLEKVLKMELTMLHDVASMRWE
jgi:glycosyltransferase involved in cell wall biosynthesis